MNIANFRLIVIPNDINRAQERGATWGIIQSWMKLLDYRSVGSGLARFIHDHQADLPLDFFGGLAWPKLIFPEDVIDGPYGLGCIQRLERRTPDGQLHFNPVCVSTEDGLGSDCFFPGFRGE